VRSRRFASGTALCIALCAGAARGQLVEPGAPGGLGGFARRAGQDFRHLPTYDTLAWLATGGVASWVAHPQDRDWVESIASNASFDEFLDPGKIVGSEVVLLPATLLAYGVGRWGSRPGLVRTADELLRAQLVSQVLTHSVKISVGRERPDGDRFSFPSGHASASFAVAAVLARRNGWKIGVPAYLGAAYVAVSRLGERRHYASDVIFGAAVGIVAGRTVTRRDASPWHVTAWRSEGGAVGLRIAGAMPSF
jgi:membrane-associated phospholipid phosphatase